MQQKHRFSTSLGAKLAGAGLCAALCVMAFLMLSGGTRAQDPPESNAPTVANWVQTYQPLTVSPEATHRGDLVLINAAHPATEETPAQLVSVYNEKNDAYWVKDKNVLLRQEVVAALNGLLGDFYALTQRHDLIVLSGYRDVAKQRKLWTNKVAEIGEEAASQWVARPGVSEHHSGYGLDLGFYRQGVASLTFDGEGAYAWIAKHAPSYGLILRYPLDKTAITGISNEPWHFRYVGLPHAQLIAAQGYCLEEYIPFLQGFPVDGAHWQTQDDQGRRYEIYYAQPDAQQQISVPRDVPYQISGDNQGGFIITVELPAAD